MPQVMINTGFIYTLETALKMLLNYQVIFLGEQHDSPAAHHYRRVGSTWLLKELVNMGLESAPFPKNTLFTLLFKIGIFIKLGEEKGFSILDLGYKKEVIRYEKMVFPGSIFWVSLSSVFSF